MKILIVGAGRIGCSVAESLVSEANDITIIDQDAKRAKPLQAAYDLRVVVGHALSPQVLQDAGAADTDLIISVTSNDETNLGVSLLAARMFNIPTRIARVRNSELRNYPRILGEEGFQATSIIWPEQALINYLIKLIDFPEAMQVLELGEGKATLISAQATAGSPLVGRPVSDLYTHMPEIPARIVAIFRRNRRIECNASSVIEAGDEVISLCDSRYTRQVLKEVSYKDSRPTHLLMVGNSEMSKHLAQMLEASEGLSEHRNFNIRIVEEDSKTSKRLAQELSENQIVLNGPIVDDEILKIAGFDRCDIFIALSDDDEKNILWSLLAKKLGAKRVIALVNKKAYSDLMQGSHIDIILSSTQAALGELIKYVRRGDVLSAYSLRRGAEEIMEIVAHGNKQSSKVVGRSIKDIALPEGCAIGAIIRGEGDDAVVLMGEPDLKIEAEDKVLVFLASKKLVTKIEKLFTVSVGFF